MDFDTLLMIAATQGGGAPVALTPGPELWPQPAFDASTGLTLLRCSVTGGQLVGNDSGSTANATATAAGGTFNVGDQIQWSFDIAANPGNDNFALTIAGNTVASGQKTVGTHSGTTTLAVASSQNMIILMPDNFGGDKVDNVSIKKLS